MKRAKIYAHSPRQMKKYKKAWDDEEEDKQLQDVLQDHSRQGGDDEVHDAPRHLPDSQSPVPPPAPDHIQQVDPRGQGAALPPPAGQDQDHGEDHGEDQDHATEGVQLPDAAEGAGELAAVRRRNTPTKQFANWQGGRKGSVIKNNVVLPVIVENRPQRDRKKINKFM